MFSQKGHSTGRGGQTSTRRARTKYQIATKLMITPLSTTVKNMEEDPRPTKDLTELEEDNKAKYSRDEP